MSRKGKININNELKKKIISLYINKKLGTPSIQKELKKTGIKISIAPIGKILTAEKKAGRIKQIKKQQFKNVKDYLKKVKIYKNPEEDRDIFNKIREVTNHDKEHGQRTRGSQKGALDGELIKAPHWANYKIVFANKANIPNKFQGIKYYKTKLDAEKAIIEKKKLED
tara:strand:- start:328 stop:831 length:504 start_codon:yes stop_codon:yes gene_type:complete